MSEKNIILKNRIDNRLQRIANVLLLNASFTDNIGLLNGKMGIAIFFYQYSRYTRKKLFEDFAGELIDEIYAGLNLNIDTPANFENGLTGIGWGIEYLVKNNFIQADTDEVLEDFDNGIYKHRINNPILIQTSDELFGYGFYHVVRLLGHKIDDNDLNTLLKKYHLIFLTDECERILEQKLYTRFNIDSLSIGTTNSFIWFLLEIYKLKIFPVKVEKVLQFVPEFIEKGLENYSKGANQFLMLRLAEESLMIIKDEDFKNSLRNVLNKKNGKQSVKKIFEDTIFDDFIRNTWQQLVYHPYLNNKTGILYSPERIIPYLDDEHNWNRRLDNLSEDNLGLNGLAGLGLGLFLRQKSPFKVKPK